jgi:hypothetical protein
MKATLLSPYLFELGKTEGATLIRSFSALIHFDTNIYIDEFGELLGRYQLIAENCENAKTLLKILTMAGESTFLKISADIFKNDLVRTELSILDEVMSERNLSTDSMSRYVIHKKKIQKSGISIYDKNNLLSFARWNEKLTNEKLSDFILLALKELVQHKTSDKIENLHNDILAKMLRAHGAHYNFSVTDQMRAGESSGGGIGSLDLCIIDRLNSPFAIIECLVARSFGEKETNVISHFSKLIEDYDKIGLSRNYLVTYCEAVNFSAAFKAYKEIIKNANNSELFKTRYKIKEYSEQKTDVTNIRLFVTSHEREEKIVQVFHYFVDLSQSEKSRARSKTI